MDWYEQEVRSLETLVAARPPQERPAVFYGSSSFRLWQTLSQDLHSDRILNLAFGGSTLEACLWFFDRLVPPAHPASLTVYAGDNDLGDGQAPSRVIATFEAFCDKVRRLPGPIPFGFISIKPSPARLHLLPAIRQVNEAARKIVNAVPGGYYIDVFSAMLSPAGRPMGELFEPDGLHLNAAGYRLWTRALEPYRNRIVIADPSNGNGAPAILTST